MAGLRGRWGMCFCCDDRARRDVSSLPDASRQDLGTLDCSLRLKILAAPQLLEPQLSATLAGSLIKLMVRAPIKVIFHRAGGTSAPARRWRCNDTGFTAPSIAAQQKNDKYIDMGFFTTLVATPTTSTSWGKTLEELLTVRPRSEIRTTIAKAFEQLATTSTPFATTFLHPQNCYSDAESWRS